MPWIKARTGPHVSSGVRYDEKKQFNRFTIKLYLLKFNYIY